jgi:hypothetical protein
MENNKTVLYLSITLGRPGTKRRVNNSEIECDTDKSLLSVSKEILDSEAYSRIVSLDNDIRRWVNTYSLPGQIFKRGIYAVPATLVEKVESKLLDFAASRTELVNLFINEYPSKIELAKSRLGSLFNPKDYPSKESMRSSFEFNTRYLSLGVPDNLNSISKDLYDKEKEKARQQWENALKEWQVLLRQEFYSLIEHLREKLDGNRENGKPKIFRDNTIKNINEFLNNFEDKNISGDEYLSKLVSQTREILTGVDADSIRDVPQVKDFVRTGFQAIKDNLDTNMVDKPVRNFNFEE